ncbi:unnamed protein product [Colias eurytheme]|nr:unnamed protein product [Colias eurytheme]
MMASARIGATAGVLISTQDVLLYSHAVGLGPILRRYMYHTAPLALMGATFAAVANTVYQYRKVDDQWNYFLGGFACGPILAVYLGSYHAVLLGGLALGTLAAAKKECLLNGIDFFPHIYSHMRTVNHWRMDYSLTKDPLEGIIAPIG